MHLPHAFAAAIIISLGMGTDNTDFVSA